MEVVGNGLLGPHDEVTLQGPEDGLDGCRRRSAVVDKPIQLWEELCLMLVRYSVHCQNERVHQGVVVIDPSVAHGFQKRAS